MHVSFQGVIRIFQTQNKHSIALWALCGLGNIPCLFILMLRGMSYINLPISFIHLQATYTAFAKFQEKNCIKALSCMCFLKCLCGLCIFIYVFMYLVKVTIHVCYHVIKYA